MLAQREKAGDARLRSLPSRIGSPVADSVLLTGYSDLWLVDVAGLIIYFNVAIQLLGLR